VDPPLAKPPEMVLMVPRREGSAGVMSVRAGFGFLVGGLDGASVVTGIMWRVSVVRSRGMAGLRG